VLLATLPAWAGDAGRGEVLFQVHCYACHSVDSGQNGLPGPNLFKVLGRRAAALPAFDYSPALREAGKRGLIWTVDQTARLIANPEAFLPGTEMTFPGLDSPAERADIVAFLRLAATRQP
jgi:cytochrome c